MNPADFLYRNCIHSHFFRYVFHSFTREEMITSRPVFTELPLNGDDRDTLKSIYRLQRRVSDKSVELSSPTKTSTSNGTATTQRTIESQFGKPVSNEQLQQVNSNSYTKTLMVYLFSDDQLIFS